MTLPLVMTVILSVMSLLTFLLLTSYIKPLEIAIYFLFSTLFTQNYFRITESVYRFIKISKGLQGLSVLQMEYTLILPAGLVWLVTWYLLKKRFFFMIGSCIWLLIAIGLDFINNWLGVVTKRAGYLNYSFIFYVATILCVVVFAIMYRKIIRREGFTI